MASHRRSTSPGLTRSAKATVLSAAAAATAAALGAAGPAGAAPGEPAGPGRAEATRARVDALHAEAERATELFNAADERTDRLREQVARIRDSVARGQERANRMRAALGAVAGAQYRSGGMDPALALLLSADPDSYLDRAAVLQRMGERQTAALGQLRTLQRKLARERAEATRALGELEQGRAEVARQKRAVEAKLSAARALLNTLTARERDAYARSARSDERSLPLPADATGRAAVAVRAARSALGRPYVWGANGPSGFDCSGLMQWSYAQAGVGLPRTSQAQRNAGRQVPLSQARPGDLVTYRDDASHVGMYVGGGRVVHAPYPGASVRYDPVGMMPVSAVTRP